MGTTISRYGDFFSLRSLVSSAESEVFFDPWPQIWSSGEGNYINCMQPYDGEIAGTASQNAAISSGSARNTCRANSHGHADAGALCELFFNQVAATRRSFFRALVSKKHRKAPH